MTDPIAQASAKFPGCELFRTDRIIFRFPGGKGDAWLIFKEDGSSSVRVESRDSDAWDEYKKRRDAGEFAEAEKA